MEGEERSGWKWGQENGKKIKVKRQRGVESRTSCKATCLPDGCASDHHIEVLERHSHSDLHHERRCCYDG